MTRKAFGLFIKTKREAANKSQADVARELGYSTSQFVSNIERGAAPLPIFKIKAMAKAIDADAKELFQLFDKVRSTEDYEEFKDSLVSS